ncbi:hypothetical protein VHUM_00470 [Vanrija humicola]|uniref:Uncharacterized protein n=1 Tax=Vanrija humicola TaxID=5417 RepID=A0A7D9A215_VANHU|nr:hypothetical protein VHUM_00470 [Vanrija humicola]
MRQATGRALARAAYRPLAVSRAGPIPSAALSSALPRQSAPSLQAKRTFFNIFQKKKAPVFEEGSENKIILSQDNLFHKLSESPFEALRQKGERIRTYSICPESYEKYHEQVPVKYECPNCGFPSHASEERWVEGKAEHDEYCPRIREVNEDEHDIRSGRRISEFENMPGIQPYEQAVSLASWDSLFFTRGFVSINSPRAIRHVSKLMTYPITVLSVLHQNGPFTSSNGRITHEGRRSMAAIHSTIHSPPGTTIEGATDIRPMAPVRIFILGARAESTLPADLWLQVVHLFPTAQFNIFFIGPEAGIPIVNERKRQYLKMETEGSKYGFPTCEFNVNPQLKLTSIQATYQDVHNQLGPFDPYQDIFFAFSPGLGFPDQAPENKEEGQRQLVQAETSWRKPLQQILETKCGLFFTAFSPTDLARDVAAVYGTQPPTTGPNSPSEYPSSVRLPTTATPPIEGVTDEFELILTPGTNPFGSRKWEIAEWDIRVGVKTNWGIWGIRGKRYEVTNKGEEEEVEEE